MNGTENNTENDKVLTNGKVKVTSLFNYPTKSGRQYPQTEIRVERKGVENDRVFLIVTKKNLIQLQFKRCPKLYYIETKIEETKEGKKAFITIPFDQNPKTFTLDLSKDKSTYPKENIYNTVIFGASCEGVSLDDNLNKAVSEYLGHECIFLHCIGERFLKNYNKVKQMKYLKENDSMTYNYTAPFLIITEESLSYLNEILEKSNEKKVDLRHFRPNIVLQGGGKEFWEKSSARLKINNMIFRNIKPCIRCMV